MCKRLLPLLGLAALLAAATACTTANRQAGSAISGKRWAEEARTPLPARSS
jgi:hypothetical protein